ncbi:MAG: molecular chaperone DnaJ, partial [Clostridiales bacterium]|nr:molecular chaperone DnaJ [Clostridiales bacterium]
PNGDLYITVGVRPHKVFRRDGTALHLDVPISFTQAALGADLELPELGGGKFTFKIPEGTQEGSEFRIRGKGVTMLRSTSRGDMIVHIHIDIPRHLTDKQKELLRQFDEASTGKEYDKRRGFLDKIKDLFN